MNVVSMKKAAAANRLRITETTLIGSRLVGLNYDGHLYQWVGTHWARLMRRERRRRKLVAA